MGLGGDVHLWFWLMSRLKISGTVSPHPSCAQARLYYYYYYYYYYYWIMIFNPLFSKCAIFMYLCIVYSTVCSATGHFIHKWNCSDSPIYSTHSGKRSFQNFSFNNYNAIYAVISSANFITTFLCVLVCCLYLVYFSYVPVLSLLLALRLLYQHTTHKE